MSDSLSHEFDRLAFEVWNEVRGLIPPELHAHLGRVEFLILDEAPPEILREIEPLDENDVVDPLEVCGFYWGVPLTEMSVFDPDLTPPRVYLFREALLELIDPEDPEPAAALREEIAITLLHEIGHHFGLSEEDLERLGYD